MTNNIFYIVAKRNDLLVHKSSIDICNKNLNTNQTR